MKEPPNKLAKLISFASHRLALYTI